MSLALKLTSKYKSPHTTWELAVLWILTKRLYKALGVLGFAQRSQKYWGEHTVAPVKNSCSLVSNLLSQGPTSHGSSAKCQLARSHVQIPQAELLACRLAVAIMR